MNRECFYNSQMVALEVSRFAESGAFDDLQFAPLVRQFLLPDEFQLYDSPLAVPVCDGPTVAERIRVLASQICEGARLVRAGRRECALVPGGALEELYAEIEGDAYEPPPRYTIESELAAIHSALDLADDVTSLRDVFIMYPEVAPREQRDAWRDHIARFLEQISSPTRLA